jgi:SAM-dependent methyltransferase
MRQLIAQLVEELRGRGRALEIGVGTGRIALELTAGGVALAGVDISPRMLARLREKAGSRWPFPVALADAVALPFGGRAFGAALAVHVLHLIPPWRQALAELVRVVVPGGVILVDPGGWGQDWVGELNDRFCVEAGIPRGFPGMNGPEELEAEMRKLGASVRRLTPVVEKRRASIGMFLDRMERGVYSFTWTVTDEERVQATAGVRAWAEERFGSLVAPRPTRREIVWRAFDLA